MRLRKMDGRDVVLTTNLHFEHIFSKNPLATDQFGKHWDGL